MKQIAKLIDKLLERSLQRQANKQFLKSQGEKMPKVGNKKFSYTSKGMKAAKAAAKKAGKKVTYKKKKK